MFSFWDFRRVFLGDREVKRVKVEKSKLSFKSNFDKTPRTFLKESVYFWKTQRINKIFPDYSSDYLNKSPLQYLNNNLSTSTKLIVNQIYFSRFLIEWKFTQLFGGKFMNLCPPTHHLAISQRVKCFFAEYFNWFRSLWGGDYKWLLVSSSSKSTENWWLLFPRSLVN